MSTDKVIDLKQPRCLTPAERRECISQAERNEEVAALLFGENPVVELVLRNNAALLRRLAK